MHDWECRITIEATIPKLAWGIRIREGRLHSGYAGSWVEVGDSSLYEGAWNREAVGEAFEDSVSLCGSGARLVDSGIMVASPSHTTEAIYSIEDGDMEWVVSNSLPMALQMANSELSMHAPTYERLAHSVSDGISAYESEWPLAQGRTLHVHFYANLYFTTGPRQSTNVSVRSKRPTPRFANFDDYRNFLSAETAGIMAHARSASRRKTFEPLAFCSVGYDSTAVAVLAREQQAELAIAFESKRKSRSDSGAEIARRLGFSNVVEKQESEYLQGKRAHRFFGTGELGTSIFFLAAEDELEGRVLFSGAHGGSMWSKHFRDDAEEIRRQQYPDTARTHFRLDVGYINLTPAFFTATSQSSLHHLSNSPEMEPWSVGGDYDRPIPRRIGEEAGVPRHMFGMMKSGGAGTSLRFGGKQRVLSHLPKADRASFENYLNTNQKTHLRAGRLAHIAAYALYFAIAGAQAKGLQWPARVSRVDHWPFTLRSSPFAPSKLFYWGIAVMRATDYAAVKGAPDPSSTTKG